MAICHHNCWLIDVAVQFHSIAAGKFVNDMFYRFKEGDEIINLIVLEFQFDNACDHVKNESSVSRDPFGVNSIRIISPM